MFDANGRVDIPRIMKGLHSDLASQQNAAAALGYIACRSEEYRDAISAQMEAIIVPLIQHLKSGQADLIHNAALLLGQCCASGNEFRQAFGSDGCSTLAQLLTATDSGTVCNVLFALRMYVGDTECPLSDELRAHIAGVLPQLLAHENQRIQLNSKILKELLEKRPTQIVTAPQTSTTTLRRDESLRAVSALAQLAVAQSKEDDNGTQNLLAWSIKLLEETSPSNAVGSTNLSLESPRKERQNQRRSSLMSPWKNRVNVGVKSSPRRLKNRQVALAVTQVADG